MSRIIITAAICAAFTLSACGKQEAVSDVPSSEELAAQADAASKALRDEAEGGESSNEAGAVDAAALTNYANALRGYAIMVPKDWTVDQSKSDDNGRVFTSSQNGATMKVNWTENREDEALSARVEAIEAAKGESGEAEFVKEDDFRASGIVIGEDRSATRILRKADGTMVEATVTYPAAQAAQMDIMAKRLLDSLNIQ